MNSSHPPPIMTTMPANYSDSISIGVIRVTGADAKAFLQAQLTQDFNGLKPGQAAPAAWLDPRGRVRACLEVVANDAGFELLAPKNLIDSLIAKLTVFVFRAKVLLTPEPEKQCFALLGDAAEWLKSADIDLPERQHSHYSETESDWIRIGPELVYAYGNSGYLHRRFDSLPKTDPADAELAAIRLGQPQVDAATESRFIPQMLNLDLIGAISFDKGCYPGQEIVARTHNLGTLKRRMFRYAIEPNGVQSRPAQISAGSAIVDSAGNDVGTVLRYACTADSTELLAVAQIDASKKSLSVGDPAQPLRLKELPHDN